ncbi:MAG TPA: Wzz/FepE/Etk N-terminal domain-containing protein [Terracidiphilus sp.]|jgi:uncharacterized protein involved in exopolysaccharide biosynthesis
MTPQTYLDPADVELEPNAETENPDAIPGLFLIEVLTVFARRKQLVGAAAAIGLLVGVVLSLLLPVKYTATTKIMTPQQTQSTAAMMMSQLAGPASGLMSSSAGAALGLRNPNDIYIGILNSRTIADGIIQQFDLKDVYRVRDLEAARKKLADVTSIAAEKSGMIAISVTDRDRTRSAQLASAYTEHLRSLSKNLAFTEASQRRLFYEEQLKTAKDNVVSAEYQLRQVQSLKGVIQPDAQSKAMIMEMAELDAQIAAKQVELQARRSFSTEHNPDVQLLESQLASMRQEKAKLERQPPVPGNTTMGLQDLAGSSLDYLNAAHELQYRQTLFDLLIRQYDGARLDEAKDAAIIQIVDAPVPPERRSSPRRTLIALLFTALGALSACAYLFLAELARNNPRLAAAFSTFKSALLSR